MNYLNILVVTWWALATATFAAFAIISRTRSYFTTALPRAGQIAICVWFLTLALGALTLLMNSDKTRLLTLHGQLSLMLIGAALLSIVYNNRAAGLRFKIFAVVFASAGVAILMWGFYLAAGDILLPRTVIEGRVDGMGTVRRTRVTSYEVVIDGIAYRAIRDVFSQIQVGDLVRVERGAASEIVFSADVISPAAR